MTVRAPRATRLSAGLSFAGLLASSAAAAPLSALEARGKELYSYGTQQEGAPPKVLLGGEAAPARLAPCASCHGEDGAGRPEGKFVPPDISWSELSKPQGKTHLNGRSRPPFSEDDVAQAVLRGTDPAGARLDAIMPQYALSRDQLDALVAYLKAIEADQAPGVSPDGIRIAAIVSDGPVKDALAAAFQEVNARGGIYNRKIELSFIEEGPRSEDAAARLDALLKDRSIFAVLAMSGASPHIAEAAERAQTLLIGAEASSEATRRNGFYLLPSIAAQMRILVDFIAKPGTIVSRTAIVFPADAAADEARRAVEEQSRKRGLPTSVERGYSVETFDAPAIAAWLKAEESDTVYFLGDRLALARLVDAARALNFYPRLLFSGAAVAGGLFDAPRGFDGKLLFIAPISPRDVLQDFDFLALREKYGLTAHAIASQGVAYAAALIFTQGLKSAGRRLSRARFIMAMESIRDFDAGVIHRIDFGPQQRLGVRGGYVVEVDLARRGFARKSAFITTE